MARAFSQGIYHPLSGASLDLLCANRFLPFLIRNRRQCSSVVEQRTHKPLVGSSNLPIGTIRELIVPHL